VGGPHSKGSTLQVCLSDLKTERKPASKTLCVGYKSRMDKVEREETVLKCGI
jgi:hypothetical protein